MDNPCVIIAEIGNTNVLVVVDPNEKFSIITTELLESLNISCKTKFIRERVIFLEKYAKTIGRIRKFNFTIQSVLLHHDVYILDKRIPFLLLGNDWITKNNVQCNSIRSHLYMAHLQKILYIPVVQQTERQPEYDQNEFGEKDSIIEEENNTDSESLSTCSTESNSTHESEGLLIDLTTPDKEIENETGPLIS